MPSNTWRTLGKGKILGYLRADLRQASSSVYIVGPWIDAFFAELVCDLLPVAINLRIVTRSPEGANAEFAEHATAACVRFETRPNTIVRLLPGLHAKVLTVDEEFFYCGSANWYRYSLEQSREIVLRGPLSAVDGLLDELELIWEQASAESLERQTKPRQELAASGYTKEVIDPTAAAKLKEVPGSFILNSKRPRKG